MRLLAPCVVCVLGLPLAAAAQVIDLEAIRATKRVAAVRTADPIVIDGVLDEAAWALAESTGDFFSSFQTSSRPPPSAARFVFSTTTTCSTSARCSTTASRTA